MEKSITKEEFFACQLKIEPCVFRLVSHLAWVFSLSLCCEKMSWAGWAWVSESRTLSEFIDEELFFLAATSNEFSLSNPKQSERTVWLCCTFTQHTDFMFRSSAAAASRSNVEERKQTEERSCVPTWAPHIYLQDLHDEQASEREILFHGFYIKLEVMMRFRSNAESTHRQAGEASD